MKVLMIHTPNKIIIALLAILMLLPQSFAYAGSDEAASEDGSFRISKESRFYIVSKGRPEEAVLETVKTADSQFAAAKVPSGEPLGIVYGGDRNIAAGDIVVRIEEAEESAEPEDQVAAVIEEQGYTIVTEGGTVTVTAKADDGLYYGLGELLRFLILEDGRPLSCNIAETPDTASRTLLLDVGRKYYSPEWIENLIRRMSWQRYSALQLHFSDAQGFGIESEKYPWLTEGREALTFEELEKICEVARACHVDIIPELDTPGHMEYIVKTYRQHAAADPEFTFEYDGTTYTREDEGFSDISNYYVYRGSRSRMSDEGIDLSNDVARAFPASLIDEYADFFAEQGSTSFCLGGDEIFGWDSAAVGGRTFSHAGLWQALEHWQTYAAETLGQPEWKGADVFIDYMNQTAARLEEKGYRCRVWNDQLHRDEEQKVVLDPDIEVVYWSDDYYPAAELAREGYKLHNSDTRWCYYVLRRDKAGGDIMDRTRKNCNGKNIFENWDPHSYGKSQDEPQTIPDENYAGGYFAIWSDQPEFKDEKTVWEDTDLRTWANSVRLWDGSEPERLDFEQFEGYVEKVGAFPGFTGDPGKSPTFAEAPEAVSAGANIFQGLLDCVGL